MDLKDFASSLPADLADKASALSTPEEFFALVESEGYELTDEQLEGIAGGWLFDEDEEDHYYTGDVREGIDEASVPASFMMGEDLGE